MQAVKINQIKFRRIILYARNCSQNWRGISTGPINLQKTHMSSMENALREEGIPFARARLGSFVQGAPLLANQYLEDSLLRSYLKRYVPNQMLQEIEPDLTRFGERVATELYHLGLQCEVEKPYVDKFTGWGKQIDKLITGPAWKKMHDIAAEEGLISISYERKYGEWSRLYGLVKNYLFCPSSGLYSCPLAMTDGAAKIIESIEDTAPWLKTKTFPRLTSRDPNMFWTSGQWMTEKRGGSDVASGTETVAVEQSDGKYKLYGYKWFSSATDANMTFTLARVVDSQGQYVQGTKGLSLFYLEVHNEDGTLNNIEIVKLKNKLGTRQLPTAELLLDGCIAYKVSDEGRGVPAISNMLKLTRIHNSISASGIMRRMMSLSRDYCTRRKAFGNLLKDYPLHVQTLARIEVETRGSVLLCLENMRLLGKEDLGIASEDEQNLLRLLVPLSKLYSGKQALEVCTEGLESFGGQGYIEDTGLPGMLRDAQVLSIWEGTTNILSLDILRAIAKSKGQVLASFSKDITTRMSDVTIPRLSSSASKVLDASKDIMKFIHSNATKQDVMEAAARDLAFSLCRTYTGALLIDHACSSVGTASDVVTAERWCEKNMSLVNTAFAQYNKTACDENFQLVFDSYLDRSRL